MEIYTDKFEKQKRNFKIYSELDPLIRDFINYLNKRNNIVTLHSCEGTDAPHDYPPLDEHSLTPYFGFNVNKESWNLVWVKVIPELMSIIDIEIGTNGFQDGIFIHGKCEKYRFWRAVNTVFRKYF